METTVLLKKIRAYLKDLQCTYETEFESPGSELYDDGGIYAEIREVKGLINEVDKIVKAANNILEGEVEIVLDKTFDCGAAELHLYIEHHDGGRLADLGVKTLKIGDSLMVSPKALISIKDV